jgi:hypothetical protein
VVLVKNPQPKPNHTTKYVWVTGAADRVHHTSQRGACPRACPRCSCTAAVNMGSTVPPHGAADRVRHGHGGGSASGCSGCCLQGVGGGQSESRTIRVTVNPSHGQFESHSFRVTVSLCPEPHPLAARAASVRVRVSPSEPVGDRNSRGRHAVRSRRRCRPVTARHHRRMLSPPYESSEGQLPMAHFRAYAFRPGSAD